MNVYRSALSAFHPEIEGRKVGQHPTIVRVMLGMFHDRPPRPRYTETWDVDVVLRYLKGKGSPGDLSDRDLTLKLTMLLALTTACRGAEIRVFKVSLVGDKGTEMTLATDELSKTSRPGKKPRSITVVEFRDHSLDVVGCLRTYLERTKCWRKGDHDQLLLSFRQPHSAVTTSSIARWLKVVMVEAGIDTQKFKAHSTRGAAVSKARAQGLSVEQILERADWARASTFRRFYHRGLESGALEFQSKVLA